MIDHKAEYDEEMMRRYQMLWLVKKELCTTALKLVKSNRPFLPIETEDAAFEYIIHDDSFHNILADILGAIYILLPHRKELHIYARKTLESDMGM